jgi:DNA-directed RNA polymerase specialized sigma24 family protein
MLAVLSPDQRVCVLLVHGFGWTYNEVAELLGMKRSEVNNHVHRGLAHLRTITIADPLLEDDPRPSNKQENIT